VTLKHDAQWKPGQSGNPKGRPPLPNHLKNIKRLTGDKFEAMVAKYGDMEEQQLVDALESKTTPVMEKIVCKVYLVALDHGDHIKLNFFLDRTVGKVKEVKEIQVLPEPFTITRPNGEQTILGAKYPDAIDAEITGEDE